MLRASKGALGLDQREEAVINCGCTGLGVAWTARFILLLRRALGLVGRMTHGGAHIATGLIRAGWGTGQASMVVR